MDLNFSYFRLTGRDGHWSGLAKKLHNANIESRINEQGRLYGIWAPMFGFSYNQLALMAVSKSASNEYAEGIRKHLLSVDGVQAVVLRSLEPTARPKSDDPPTKPGMYVNRWMRFNTSDIDEVVEISNQAWGPWENAFDSEIQGLFREKDSSDGQTWLLLKTWYPNFAVWHETRSVEKAGDAGPKFRRRSELTQASEAHALELVILKP